MYAVIFTARMSEIDETYSSTASRMRELAQSKYGCVEFTALVEGDQEVSISYWESLDHVKAWHQDPEHRIAQELGRQKWYSSFQVQVVQVLREYEFGQPDR